MTDRHEPLSPVKRALLELRELRARLDAAEAERHQPIAVIGVGCRFPGAVTDEESFWSLLWNGQEAISEVPSERWNAASYFDPDPAAPGKMATRRGAFLDGIDQFDHGFFGISPREADSMDPQQRLVLEVAWEALEHAGLSPDALRGQPAGIFVGAGASDYLQLLLRRSDPASIDAYMASGGVLSVIAGRLAYFLGTQGPAMVIDTACSSSLVAIHQACQSLRRDESRLAIAAGVGVLLLPELTVNFSQARMLSSDGRCKTFDASADGYVRGEGCGAVILKRLSDARRDSDRVLAVVRGSAVNQDGRSSGLTVPNGVAQEAVIGAALRDGRVLPSEIDYVEAHGTGTSLGDPIEVLALARALGQDRAADQPLLLGSVKTNLGHLEAAAGIAGFIKVALALQRGALPPSLHFKTPNPHVNWQELPVQVVTAQTPWPDRGRPRRAGVSSFGFSGTNAHVVLESAPEPQVAAVSRAPASLLALSARSSSALRTLGNQYVDLFRKRPNLDPEDVSHTAALGRRHFATRLAVVGRTLDDLRAGLEEAMETGLDASEHPEPRFVFAFPGQGRGFSALGQALYASSEPFRRTIDRASRALEDRIEPKLHVLFEGGGDDSLLDDPTHLQPALFAFEYALATLWQSWGIRPAAVVGHSLGEYAAACVAGVLDFEGAIRLVAERGRLSASLRPTGAMAAIFADERTVRSAVADYDGAVDIAGLNGPTNIAISGSGDHVRRICAELAARGIDSRTIESTHGFHSSEIAPILDELERVAARVSCSTPTMPFASTLRGALVGDGEQLSAAHWRRHMREPVRFADAVGALVNRGFTHFIEVGPGATLCGLGRRLTQESPVHWLPSVVDAGSEWVQLLTTLARLYTAGADIDWHGAFSAKGHVVSLPTYPFERSRRWIEDAAESGTEQRDARAPETQWAKVTGAAHRQAACAPFDLNLPGFPEKWRALHERSIAVMSAILSELGALARPGETCTLDDVVRQCGIRSEFYSLIERWLSHLEAAGYLDRQDSTYVSRVPLVRAVPAALVEQCHAAFRDLPDLLRYFECCETRLAAVLTGRASPLDTLFPDGDMSIAEGLYGGSSVARYFNAIATSAIATAAAAQPEGRRLRVLEIGAGTGGTTDAVLPALPSDNTEYLFTDIGPLFVVRGSERLASFPFVSFDQLDIEDAQAIERVGTGRFDIVIATNVLHATRDLDATLDHVRRLLAPGGLLVAIETTEAHTWLDVTIALVPGWRRFADAWRTNQPLLAPEIWSQVIERAGFERSKVLPPAGSPATVLGQHVIIAQAPGRPVASAPLRSPIADRAIASQGLAIRQTPDADVLTALADCPASERRRRLVRLVRQEVIRVLRLPDERPPSARERLMDLGIDSLTALELRNRLKLALQLPQPLTATLIFDYPSIDDIASYLDSLFDVSLTGPASPDGSALTRAEEIARLDDDAVAELVATRLRDLGM